jgi:hypothetical protein
MGPGSLNGGSGGSNAHIMNDAGAAQCNPPGATRPCCVSGVQTCSGSGEFGTWGPCQDSSGAAVTCSDGCSAGEFGPKCEKPDSGSMCGPGEFGPSCDAGMPPPPPPPPMLCSDPTVSNEPEILAAYDPAMGQTVSENGQIKVWITDECPAFIAPNEQVDATTGMITMPGDRTAKAVDNYLCEPALYIAPETAESGGTPHFPQWVKGAYNNMPPTSAGGGSVNRLDCTLGTAGSMGLAIDTPPAGTNLSQSYNTEFVWDVASLGLKPGTYSAEFVIHDGDRDRAVGCVTITVTAVN